jgi:hypothetical protein
MRGVSPAVFAWFVLFVRGSSGTRDDGFINISIAIYHHTHRMFVDLMAKTWMALMIIGGLSGIAMSRL